MTKTMNNAVSFPYHPANSGQTEGVLPYLPVALNFEERVVQVEALLDSGASVNVLPYTIGLTTWRNLGYTNNTTPTGRKFSEGRSAWIAGNGPDCFI